MAHGREPSHDVFGMGLIRSWNDKLREVAGREKEFEGEEDERKRVSKRREKRRGRRRRKEKEGNVKNTKMF